MKSSSLFGFSAVGFVAITTVAYLFADRNISEFEGNYKVISAGESDVDATLIAIGNVPEHVGQFGLGRVATRDEIKAWDIDVLPDGTGLPKGRGNVEDGEMLFVDYCAVCHGDFAEGVGNWPKLAGGEDTLADEDPLKTVGSYWPYLSTTFDYVRRSMPFGNAQSLSDDDVYAIVAYILYSNYLVEDDFELSHETFLNVEMPNAGGFIEDDRANSEYPIWNTDSADYCMSDCKDSVEITMRAAVLDVTPDETKDRRIQELVNETDPDAVRLAEALASADLPPHQGLFGLGRVALPAEVVAWDIDVLPDGTGLPAGRGNVEDGEMLFVDYCAVCHGDFAEGVGNWPKLAGGEDTLADEDPLKTVGSYWPYLSTTFDYVRRSMPFGNAQSLSNDDVYAIVAYILYSNYVVEDDFELSHENFMDVDMPNAEGFIVDDRTATEYPIWNVDSADYCMSDCKDGVEITMRAAVLDVTPEETEAAELVALVDATNPNATISGDGNEATVSGGSITLAGAFDAELVASGESVFKKCKACHQIGEGAKNKTGPHLNLLFGRMSGGVEGFKYSNVMTSLGEQGVVWNDDTLAEFLTNPKAFAKGTKMSFSGLKKESDIEALLEYLKSAGN